MTTASQPQQTIPVQLHQARELLVLTAPMPGLEAQDISVTISGPRVTTRGEYRGSRQNQPEVLVSEWTVGPYYREFDLPQPVNGVLTNATYGNGVLVLSMPTLGPGRQGKTTEFRLEATKGPRGQRLAYTGSGVQPTIEHEREMEQTSKQTDRLQGTTRAHVDHTHQ